MSILTPLKKLFSKAESGFRLNPIEMDLFNNIFSRGSHYDAGKRGRLQDDWSTQYNTPSQNFKQDWRGIIARSISSADNNPHTQAIFNALSNNIIGTGLRPIARVKTKDGKAIEGINKILNNGWARYNDQWDATRKNTHMELQRVRFFEIFRTGSTITNLLASRKGNYLSISNQILNVLRLDDSKDLLSDNFSLPDISQTQFGINLDASGAAVSYWIQGIKNPVSSDSMRINFRQILAEQYIGMPWLMAALKYLWANENLIKDKLVASRLQAMISMFVPNSVMAGMLGKQKNAENQIEMNAGRIMYGNKGEEPKILQADDSVKDVLDPLQRLLLHGIGMTQGLSYQTFTRDLVKTNMASGRINVNEDRKMFRNIQMLFAKDTLQPDWNIYVKYMFLEGNIPGMSILDYNKDRWKYNQAQWIPNGFNMIDPAKESAAAIDLYQNDMLTLEKWYGDQGVEWKDALNQIAEEKKYMKKIGLGSPGLTVPSTNKRADIINAPDKGVGDD